MASSANPNTSAATPTADELAAFASDPIFSPEEEASLLASANEQKSHANSLFTSGAYSDAISAYGRALASVPNYLDYEVAVLRANVAACHVKLEEWKEAVDAATECLERLEGLGGDEEANGAGKGAKKDTAKGGNNGQGRDKAKANADVSGVVEELSDSDGEAAPSFAEKKGNDAAAKDSQEAQRKEEERKKAADDAAALDRRLSHLNRLSHTTTDVRKLRTKALLRRAKARASLGSWSDLQGADDDYRAAAATPGGLALLDKKAVDQALRELPARLDAAKQKEIGEMMGKLKSLGNGLLKPFGLSTDNFNFVKDEKTGGYSVQMN
ncbi:hypothetical protein DIS24_g10588 [Lasiodiplodia hormozganensis]|uniref:Tetratricopeptide repeat protein 1 n=1 Tax=Lasiodiplodia hormozganensis TaxID=869390 RepID=A0AA39XQ56_9PEZI|nr:hypothetical protein DIS24_g10588 [Lasiodiplodia hormozganensis]